MTFETSEPPYLFRQGTSPLLISMPHAGTYLPPALAARLTAEARQVPDTDWHLERFYAMGESLGASMLIATHSRYVIDLNRPPDGSSLYPGRSVTGLCPVDTFDDTPLYAAGDVPDDAEIAARRAAIWQPYHDKLAQVLADMRACHGTVALWDAHSIRSRLPRFFEGTLPDFNLGTADGASCDAGLATQLLAIAQRSSRHTSILNGRFKGGYITRHYGAPDAGVHAVQLEMAQSSYMEESLPFRYLEARAREIQPYVRDMLQAMLDFVRAAR